MYAEPISIIGFITIGQAWKIGLIGLLLIYFLKKINIRRPLFQKFVYFYSVKTLFNTNIFNNPKSNFYEFSRFLIFPLLFEYFRNKKKETICTILLLLAQFCVLSSIPFHLGWLEPLRERSMIGFGFEDVFSSSGIFQGVHAAATSYSMAFLIIMFFTFIYRNEKSKTVFFTNKVYNIFLLALAFYSLFLTFVRTGYIMCFLGLIVMLFCVKKESLWANMKLYSLLFIICIGLIFLVLSNEVLYARLFDQRIYGGDDVGSGRLLFWRNALNIWWNGNVIEFLFGVGFDNLTNYNLQTTGLPVFSHNQFLDALAQNGIIGFFLYFMFIINLFVFIRKRKNSVFYSLAMALFTAYVLMDFFQGGIQFIAVVLFVLSLCLFSHNNVPQYLDNSNKRNNQKAIK